MNSVVFAVVLCYISCRQISSVDAINSADEYKLTLIHANDLFGAFAGVNSDNSLCDLNTQDQNQCIGGAPKIVSKLTEWRTKGDRLFFVNAGNSLGGYWYRHFGSKVVTDFYKELQFDVINLGLSDYELYDVQPDSPDYYRETYDNITQFLSEVTRTSRVVSCNVDVQDKYINNFYSNVRRSERMYRSEQRRVAFIGFVKNPNPNTNTVKDSSGKRQSKSDSSFGGISIGDPIKCLQDESEELRRNGADIIIAIGSGDEELFKEIATNVPNVDIVVGSYGLTKNLSLLRERTAHSYPDMVLNDNNVNAVVVTADVYGKSIGRLTVKFDKRGNIKESEGTLIELDRHIDSDSKTAQLVNNYQRSLYVGSTKVFLDASHCMSRECNIGDLMADSMLFYRINYINETFVKSLIKYKGSPLLRQRVDENRDVIALISSESISNSIGNARSDEYFITKISLDNMFDRKEPKIQMFILDGKTIRQLLSAYIRRSDLLQVSGMKIIYDLLKPINETIIEISVKCRLCPDNSYNELMDNKLYDVLLPQNIQLDQNDHSLRVAQDMSAFHIIEQYIKENSPIKTTIDNRITIIGKRGNGSAVGVKSGISMTLFSTLIAVCHLWL